MAVGVGFDYGPISTKIGVEGGINKIVEIGVLNEKGIFYRIPFVIHPFLMKELS